jgi:ankyrin repeat protein
MEVIRVPHVSLVDCFGKKLGTYSDSPAWWGEIQTKTKHDIVLTASYTELNSNHHHHKHRIFSGKVSPMDADNDSNNYSNSMDNLDDMLDDDEFVNEVNDVNANDYVEQMANQIRIKELAKEAKNDVLGETLLHIAVMYDHLPMIKFLIEKKGYNVNLRCISGKFSGGFNSKLTTKLIEESEYEMLAYYGEYPLALAACFASKEVYDYLISQGADPNLPGNSFKIISSQFI